LLSWKGGEAEQASPFSFLSELISKLRIHNSLLSLFLTLMWMFSG